ncbi:MAG: hypothetical protein JNK15_03155 [Planctomycetes bacterium]|nr:hypothetical protein [Planctomycetota bacterium]
MAKTLPPTFLSEIERPQGVNEPLWLVEMELDQGDVGRPPVLLRVCDGVQEITWPVGAPTTTTWTPFAFEFSPIEQTKEGDLSTVELTVDNSARTLMRFLHDAHGLEGNRATLYLVYRHGLVIAYPNHEFEKFDMEVLAVGASDEAVTFRLGLPNWFEVMSPVDRYVPKRCRHDFGSGDCGYVVNAFGAFSRCPKTIEACNARALDMAARGLPSVLPGNFGGHPGISDTR